MKNLNRHLLFILKNFLKNSTFLQDLMLTSIDSINSKNISRQSYSQYGQDLFLRKLLSFLPYKPQFLYIDIGAHDGITFSNSFFLDELDRWNGICIEANSSVFPQLIKNRKSECLNLAISDNNGVTLFLKNDGYSEMLSGIASKIPRKHLKRIRREQIENSGRTTEVFVDTLTLNELCRAREISEIDLLLLDVEGAEKSIIGSIDFEILRINIICVERNFSSIGILYILKKNGFFRLIQIGADDIYLNSRILQDI